MENNNQTGSEYNNIIETWEQNEKRKENEDSNKTKDTTANEALSTNHLEQTIKNEAAEYDNVNKEDRVLGGDRATVRDDENSSQE